MWLSVMLAVCAATTSAQLFSIPEPADLGFDFGEESKDLLEFYKNKDDTLANVETPSVPLDGNSFFIYNKFYSKAKLAQHKTRLITFEPTMAADQIWILEEQKNGFYYIKNAYHDGYRLAKYGRANDQISVYNGRYKNDQLWQLKREGDCYRIYNKVYSSARLAKGGSADYRVFTFAGNKYEDQLWKLVPRFAATASKKVIWTIDNRQNFQPVSSSFNITTGVKLTNSNTVSTKNGFVNALKAAVIVGASSFPSDAESTPNILTLLSARVSSSQEHTWFTEGTSTFTVPAGKKMTLVQTVIHFTSPYSKDNCSLYTHERLQVSS